MEKYQSFHFSPLNNRSMLMPRIPKGTEYHVDSSETRYLSASCFQFPVFINSPAVTPLSAKITTQAPFDQRFRRKYRREEIHIAC